METIQRDRPRKFTSSHKKDDINEIANDDTNHEWSKSLKSLKPPIKPSPHIQYKWTNYTHNSTEGYIYFMQYRLVSLT